MFCSTHYICFNNKTIIIDSSEFTFFIWGTEGEAVEGIAFKCGIL